MSEMTSKNRANKDGADSPTEPLQQAALWFATLADDNVNPQEKADWQLWLAASHTHQQAWDKVQQISQRFDNLPITPSRAALNSSAKLTRRQALQAFSAFFISTGLIIGTARHQHWLAQYRTARGDIKQFSLQDNSQLWLNTASAVDIQYNESIREIILRQGELYVSTAADNQLQKRPLVVNTDFGKLTALGTEFGVRQFDNKVLLSVFDGTVEISPNNAIGALAKRQRVNAGQQVYFNASHIEEVLPLSSPSTWTKGLIVANDMRLADFIEQLNRYFTGQLSCHASAADLRIVGSYPVTDISRVLTALENSLPIKIQRTLPWWVRIKALDI